MEDGNYVSAWNFSSDTKGIFGISKDSDEKNEKQIPMEPSQQTMDDMTNDNVQDPLKKDSHEGKKRIVDALERFGQNSTVHGIYHTTNGQRGKCSRVLYGLCVISSLVAMLVLVTSLTMEARKRNTTTKFEVVSCSNIEFPTVKICNLSPLSFKKPDDPLLLLFLALYDGVPYPEALERVNISQEFLDLPSREMFERYKFKFEEFVVESHYNGIKVEPSDWELESSITLYGTVNNCFSFNGPNYTSTHGPKLSSWTGSSSGLSVLLNIQQDQYGPLDPMVAGVRVFVTHYKESPRMGQDGVHLAPGSNYVLALSPVTYSFLEPPYTSYGNEKCVEDDDELLSKMLKGNVYDENECYYQCVTREANLQCGCYSFDVGEIDGLRECKVNDFLMGCWINTTNWLFIDLLFGRLKCDCPKRCSFVDYNMKLSSSLYPSIAASQVVMKDLNESSIERVRENYLKVNVFIESELVKHLKHEPEFNFEYFLSRVGGQMGLTLGASMISVLEFFEVIFVILYTSIKQILMCIWSHITNFPNLRSVHDIRQAS